MCIRDRYLTIQAAVGISTDVISQTQVRLGEGIAGWVAKTGQPLVVNGPDDLPEFLRQSMLCLLYTSPSPRDRTRSRMPSSA